jgi:malate dehydrogenase (oxaloacetate-decarboxylating)(NADP+)
LPEADNIKILKAAQIVIDEGIGYPILLGNETRIRNLAAQNGIDLEGLPIYDPRSQAMEANGSFTANCSSASASVKATIITRQKK